MRLGSRLLALLALLALLTLLAACSETETGTARSSGTDESQAVQPPSTSTVPARALERPDRTTLLGSLPADQPRTALVVGNGGYRHWPRLPNPPNDATDVARALTGLGFEVIQEIDADNATLDRAVRRYRDRLSQKGGVGLFFFAGHGSQIAGENYLIPVDARGEEADLLHKTLKLDFVLTHLEQAGNPLNLVMLDACRNNPFARGWRSASRGLAQTNAPRGTLLSYATAPNDVAADGTGRNSPYTAGFLDVLAIPGLPVERVFKQVRIRVQQATKDRQVPWESSSVTGDFYFRPGQSPEQLQVSAELTQMRAEQERLRAERERLAREREQELAELERIQREREEALATPLPSLPTPADEPSGRLSLASTPRGARWYLDGRYRGVTPADVDLAPGRYRLRLSREGYQDWNGELQIAGDKSLSRNITLASTPAIGASAAPSPTLTDAFEQQLAALEEEARRLQDQQEWQTAQAEDSIAAYDRYLQTCGLCAYRRQAGEGRAAVIERERRLAADQALFQRAQALGSAAAYQAYLKTCEVCSQSDQALTALLQMPGAELPESIELRAFRDTLRDGTAGPEMAWIPKGCFQMGSPASEAGRDDDERQHRVCVEAFALAKHEVTNGEYRRFKPDHDSGEYKGNSLNGDHQPVVEVSWNDAVAYADWLSRRSGQRYRLPTEAEWEYAARAGTTTARYWGEDPDQACRYANVHDQTSKRENGFGLTHHNCDDGYAVTAPVGRFQANGYGLHDMLGNVWEWTCSQWSNAYDGSEQQCQTSGGAYRVLRGSCWFGDPGFVRSARRSHYSPGLRDNFLGFRLARSL